MKPALSILFTCVGCLVTSVDDDPRGLGGAKIGELVSCAVVRLCGEDEILPRVQACSVDVDETENEIAYECRDAAGDACATGFCVAVCVKLGAPCLKLRSEGDE